MFFTEALRNSTRRRSGPRGSTFTTPRANATSTGSGGAVVVGIGHGVKEVAEAMLRQAGRIAFAHGSQFTTQAAVDLAAKLVAFSPAGLTRVYFLSGGSEAVETAMKLARQY
jgi:adenosylmethionine-8-amino-7-oxononanoate aminotransferase